MLDVVSDDLNLGRITDAQVEFVRPADEADIHRVEALQLGRDRVNRHLVGGGEQDVLLVPAHGAWTGPITGEGAVHDGEQAGMDLAAGS